MGNFVITKLGGGSKNRMLRIKTMLQIYLKPAHSNSKKQLV